MGLRGRSVDRVNRVLVGQVLVLRIAPADEIEREGLLEAARRSHDLFCLFVSDASLILDQFDFPKLRLLFTRTANARAHMDPATSEPSSFTSPAIPLP